MYTSTDATVDVHDDDVVRQAAAVLEVDPDLTALRAKLVPRRVTEVEFWQCYFAQVSVVKREAGRRTLDPSLKAPPGFKT